MRRVLLAILCGAALALLPVASAHALPAPDLNDECFKVPCPYLHLFAVCKGDVQDLEPPFVIIGNDTSDCR